jgi:hypothetical protein
MFSKVPCAAQRSTLVAVLARSLPLVLLQLQHHVLLYKGACAMIDIRFFRVRCIGIGVRLTSQPFSYSGVDARSIEQDVAFTEGYYFENKKTF